MFGNKTKQPPTFDLDRELGRILDAARDAHISSYRIAESLQRRADEVRQRQATTGMHSGMVGYRG